MYGIVSGIAEETKVIARLPATVDTPIEPDETYAFAVHERNLRFFDNETGSRTERAPVRA